MVVGKGAPLSQWASPACRQRGYRQRLKAGTVRTARDRRKKKELQEAARLEREAEWLERCAKDYAKRAKDAARSAASIRKRWASEDSGQTSLITKAAK